MPALAKEELHERFLEAVGVHVGWLTDVPLVVRVPEIAVPLAVWAFTLTSPPGGRHPSESKIQLIMPGQGRQEHGNLEGPEGAFKLLVGIHPTEDLFVLWDAYRHRNFAYSKNVQVRGPVLWDAQIYGLATSTRQLASGRETIIAARSDHLVAAIKQRINTE